MAGRKPLNLKESDITTLYRKYQIIKKLGVLYPCEDKLYSLIKDNNYIDEFISDEFEIINNGLKHLIQNHSELINKCRYKMNLRIKIHHFLSNLNAQKVENLTEHQKEILSLKDQIHNLTAEEYFKFYKLSEILMRNTNNQIKNRQFENRKIIKPKRELAEKQTKRKKENHLKFFIGSSFLSVQKIIDPNNQKTVIELLDEMIKINFMYNLTLRKSHDLIQEFHLNQDLPMFFELHYVLNQMLNHPLNQLLEPKKE